MPGKRRAASTKPANEKDSKESEQTKHKTKNTKKTPIAELNKGTPKEENANNEKVTESSEVKRKGPICFIGEEQNPAPNKFEKYFKMNRNRSELVSKLDNYKPVEQVIELGDGKINADSILISSWNVGGLFNILKRQDLHNYVKERQPDILCLNETKLSEDNIKGVGSKWIPQGYTSYFNCCKIRKWYSGTALITKYKPLSVTFDIGIKKHDLEGRTITAEFEKFYLVACYVPNAGEELVGLKYRVEEWDPDFRNYVGELKKKKPVVICGDLNCAHLDIDIHNTNGKEKFAGFSPEERKNFGELLNSGWVDTFRHLHPAEKKFSFFSIKLNNRPKNKGWRLDYFLINKENIGSVQDSLINNKIYGSDHLPIELILKPDFS